MVEKQVVPFIPPVKTEEQARLRYGNIENGIWKDETKWMKIHTMPEWFKNQVVNTATGKSCSRIYMNKDMIAPFDLALSLIKKRNLCSELKSFDGCFMIRDIRGVPGKLSTHSYGLSVDINAKENGLGKEPQFSPELVKCFTDAGFVWGGNFKRKDGMHFQFSW